MANGENNSEEQFLPLGIADRVVGVPLNTCKAIIDCKAAERRKKSANPKKSPAAISFDGTIVPVINLRTELGLPPADEESRQVIVLLELAMDSGGYSKLGLMVDTVHPLGAYVLGRGPVGNTDTGA